MNLPTWYSAGTASVEGGSTTVSGTGAFWGIGADDDNIMVGDLFIVPSQPLVPAVPVSAVTPDGELELLWAWPGADVVDQPYIIRYAGITERSTAQTRKVLEQLGEVSAYFDIQVDDTPDRLALETVDRPLRANYRVLVSDIGDGSAAIYSKATSAYGNWTDPAPYSGPRGIQGEDGPPAVNWLGPYDPAMLYEMDDAVRFNGSSFRKLTNSAAGTAPSSAAPPVDNANWQVIAAKGADGTGTGDVVGPEVSTAGFIAVAADESGKHLDYVAPEQLTASLEDMIGDTGAGGAKGMVPAPAAGDAAAKKFLSASGDWESIPGGAALFNLSPLYLEQVITGFHGRGMLAAETNDASTETTVSADAVAGDQTVTLTAATSVMAGSNVTIQHDNGKYWTYWVFEKAGSVLTLLPSLKWDVSTGRKAERTWFNRSHAGKFYMRQLAQRLVDTDSMHMQMPAKGRAFFTQFITGAGDDALTPFGGAAVNYFDRTSVNGEGATFPPRFLNRRTAFASIPGPGSGAYSAMKTVVAGASYIARIALRNDNPLAQLAIKVMANTDPVRELASEVFTGQDSLVGTILTIPFRVPANASSVFLRFDNLVASASNLSISQIEVFEAEALRGNVLRQNPDLRVVVCGDSWASGDISNPERESFVTQLAIELPNATVINKGGGGSTIWANLPNFQTIVADENPDIVILHTGVNEAYTPYSGTFVPNAVAAFADHLSQFLGRCMAIGAKPILIGTPALAEADAGSGFSSWTLNDRASIQAAWAYQNL